MKATTGGLARCLTRRGEGHTQLKSFLLLPVRRMGEFSDRLARNLFIIERIEKKETVFDQVNKPSANELNNS